MMDVCMMVYNIMRLKPGKSNRRNRYRISKQYNSICKMATIQWFGFMNNMTWMNKNYG